MKYLKLTGMIIISITLCSCAHQYTGDTIAEPYGFLYGIWHGLIFWLSLIGTIFSDDISIIGKPNDGFLYHFGFAIGLISSFAIRIRP